MANITHWTFKFAAFFLSGMIADRRCSITPSHCGVFFCSGILLENCCNPLFILKNQRQKSAVDGNTHDFSFSFRQIPENLVQLDTFGQEPTLFLLQTKKSRFHDGPALINQPIGWLLQLSCRSNCRAHHQPWKSISSPVLFVWLWENFVWCSSRLAATKSSVIRALADDFDTPRAIAAVMNLVHQGNRQLQPVSQVRLRNRILIPSVWRVGARHSEFSFPPVFSLTERLAAPRCLQRWSATSETSWMCSESTCCTVRSGLRRHVHIWAL